MQAICRVGAIVSARCGRGGKVCESLSDREGKDKLIEIDHGLFHFKLRDPVFDLHRDLLVIGLGDFGFGVLLGAKKLFRLYAAG